MQCTRAKATLSLPLQRVHLLQVGCRVDVDGCHTGRQPQTLLAGTQNGHLQHCVQESHPVVFPEQLAPFTCSRGAGQHAGLTCSRAPPVDAPGNHTH